MNFWLKRLLDQTEPVVNIYSLWGMIFIESLLWSPFVFLMLAAAFSLHRSVAGRGLGRLRRESVADDAAHFASADAAGVLFRHAADFHPLVESFEIPALCRTSPGIFVCSPRPSISIRKSCRRNMGMRELFRCC